MRIESCPLCGGGDWAEDRPPEPNLYSEMIAALLGQGEAELLAHHGNWRCAHCGLIVKRRWFDQAVMQRLFTQAVAVHPRGWDTVLGRFSPAGFRGALERWAAGLETQTVSDVRRGERELRSILGALSDPADVDGCLEAIADGDVPGLRAMSDGIVAAIGEPAPFSRFAGFRSRELWDYLNSTAGVVTAYAEVGCPLWGLLPVAAESGAQATFLSRDEPNYWGDGCRMAGVHCATKLFDQGRIGSAAWSTPGRYSMIGLFQYLDHVADPLAFLSQLFAKSDSAAVILDGGSSPVAIQHVTGWTHASMSYVADRFGKRLHTGFDELGPSGNVLYLLSGQS